MTVQGLALSVDEDEPIVAVVSGSFYALDTLSGQTQHRLHRRHLDAMDNSTTTPMRLDLGSKLSPIDMELKQDSAWTDESVVVVRRGDDLEEIPDAVDKNCFLSGRLTSQTGGASINRCGKMTGLVQTKDFVYVLEQAEDGDLNAGVKVTMRRSLDIESLKDGAIYDEDSVEQDHKRDLGEILDKRQQGPIVSEVAVYLDSYFVDYMAANTSKTNDRLLSNWVVQKWNTIRAIFGDVAKVGVPFDNQLKKVEIWRTNPSYYQDLGRDSRSLDYLIEFCEKTPKRPNYDHKALYTYGTGQSYMGMAYVKKICNANRKCSHNKAKGESVYVEIHEYGHNLGFNHDPKMGPCTDPKKLGGFMGWGRNEIFLDCYSRRLLQVIRDPKLRCLYEKNVNLPTLNNK